MKVLVIPDIHLKPWMFDKAEEIFNENVDIEGIVVLGDLVDEFEQGSNLGLYETTLYKAIEFAKNFPDTLWCYGNHDISYLWEFPQSGYSELAIPVVKLLLGKLEKQLGNNLTFVHRIDNVIFSHAGICKDFVDLYVPISYDRYSVDKAIKWINELKPYFLWKDNSPLWVRPQFEFQYPYGLKMWKPRKLLQVVGHTPMKTTTKEKSVISCDVFSLCRNGVPYGDQKFTVIDTKTKEFYTI